MGEEQLGGTPEQEAEAHEFKITPEIETQILAKLQDIDSPGIPYAGFNRFIDSSSAPLSKGWVRLEEATDELFSLGLINRRWYINRKSGKDVTEYDRYVSQFDKRILAQGDQNRKRGVVFFNVTGKSMKLDRGEKFKSPRFTEIAQSHYTRPHIAEHKNDCITTLFDLKDYKYLDVTKDEVRKLPRVIPTGEEGYTFMNPASQLPSRTFALNNPYTRRIENPEDFQRVRTGTDEFGFAAANRISPRYFTGIVYYCGDAGAEQFGLDLSRDKDFDDYWEYFTSSHSWLAGNQVKTDYARTLYRIRQIEQSAHSEEELESLRQKAGELRDRVYAIVPYHKGAEGMCKSIEEEVAHIPIASNPELLKERSELIAKEMVKCAKDNPNLLVPIYDYQGNLLWPRQMTRKEVIEYIKPKEEKKEE
jgi:hypothetical protein